MNKIYYERPNRPQNGNRQSTQNAQKDVYTGKAENVQEEFGRTESPYMSTEQQEQQYYQPSYEAPVYDAESKTETGKNTKIKEWIANIALVVLSILLGISLVGLIAEVRWVGYDYTRDESDFWYYIDKEFYGQVVDYRWENEALGIKKTAELEQCYAVADYFEAASLYKVALYHNDTEKMEQYVTTMKESYSKMDDVSYLAENINDKLGIENPLE